MQIRTKAVFYDEEKKEDRIVNYSFDLLSVVESNESENGNTIITIDSNRTEILIKFDVFWGLIKEVFFKTKEVCNEFSK